MAADSPPDLPSSPAPPSTLSRLGGVSVAWLGQAALWAILWLGLISFPQPPAAGLDPSWRMTLGYAMLHQLQFGVDLVFTYGPLGYLLPATNSGGLYVDHLVWQVGANAVFATTIWLLGRSLRGWKLAIYYVTFVAFGVSYGDAVHISMILLLALALLREPVAVRRWLVVLAGAMLAVLALVKFTNLMLAVFAVACVAGHHAWRRRWVDFGVVSVGFGGSFLVGWALCGQHLGNLPAYFINSLNASLGYGDGMAVYETAPVFALGLGAALSVAGYYALTLYGRRDFPRALAMALIAAATSFINWKHGYIRADGHVFAHYITCLLVAASFPVLLDDDGPLRGWKRALLGLTAAFSLAGAYIVSPNSITDAPAIWNYHVKTTVNALKLLPVFVRNSKSEYATVAKANTLAGLKAYVGRSSIDMMGSEQSYLLFSGLNYTPRPVFQSYFPYTGRLLRLNEDFYKSERAPTYVAQRLDTIDYRLPANEDSLATRYLYHHYTFVTNEAGFLLWHRNPPDPALDPVTPLSSTRVAFAQAVAVPTHGDDPIWGEVEVRPSLLGRLRAFLYKAPILTIKVADSANNQNTYRLIRDMARTGFLLYPHFTNNYHVERFEGGDAPTRVTQFSVELPEDDRKYFQSEIEVRFSTLQPFPHTAAAPSQELTQARFRMFDRAPMSVNALYAATPLLEDGHEVLSAHPPSAIEFNVDFPATRVIGRFGLAAASYTPPNATDGVEFTLDWSGADGRSTRLFTRLIQPATVPADRGFQGFDVALPQNGGRLILRTNPGPNNDLSFDWAFWGHATLR